MVLTLKRNASDEEIRSIKKKLHQKARKTGLDIQKFSGILKLKEDPLVMQQKARDESLAIPKRYAAKTHK